MEIEKTGVFFGLRAASTEATDGFAIGGRRQAGMQVGVVGRLTESVGGHRHRPPTRPRAAVRFRVLKRRVYLKIHIDKKADSR